MNEDQGSTIGGSSVRVRVLDSLRSHPLRAAFSMLVTGLGLGATGFAWHDKIWGDPATGEQVKAANYGINRLELDVENVNSGFEGFAAKQESMNRRLAALAEKEKDCSVLVESMTSANANVIRLIESAASPTCSINQASRAQALLARSAEQGQEYLRTREPSAASELAPKSSPPPVKLPQPSTPSAPGTPASAQTAGYIHDFVTTTGLMPSDVQIINERDGDRTRVYLQIGPTSGSRFNVGFRPGQIHKKLEDAELVVPLGEIQAYYSAFPDQPIQSPSIELWGGRANPFFTLETSSGRQIAPRTNIELVELKSLFVRRKQLGCFFTHSVDIIGNAYSNVVGAMRLTIEVEKGIGASEPCHE